MGLFFLKLLIILFWFFIAYTIIKAYTSFAPWVPIYSQDLARTVSLVNLQPNEEFIDLGCGNGKLCFALAKKNSGHVSGVELVWPLFLICKIRQLQYNSKILNFYFSDLFKINIAKYDIIYIYGLPKYNKQKIVNKLLTEAKNGARIISYCFEIPGLNLVSVNQPQPKDLPIFNYIINN